MVEAKVTDLFCIADDFYSLFDALIENMGFVLRSFTITRYLYNYKIAIPNIASISETFDEDVDKLQSMIEKTPPKGVSFLDLIATFAMSYQRFAWFVLHTLR